MPETYRPTTIVVLAVVTVGVGLLWLTPYDWPNGGHAQEVLPIVATLHPDLFQRDFAVQSFLGPTPRSAYQGAIVALARLGLGIPAGYLLAQTVTLIAAVAAILRLGCWLTASRDLRLALVFAVPFAFWLVAANTRGWNVPILGAGSAVPSTFAMAFALWAWCSALRRTWGAAYALLGAAAIVQFLVGFIPALLLAPVLVHDVSGPLLRRPQAMRRILAGLGVCAACLLAVAVPMYLAARGTTAVSAAELIRVFGRVRAPHHWIPSSAGGPFWLNQLLLAAGGAALALLAPSRSPVGRIRLVALTTVAGTALLLVVNYVFVELIPVAWIAKLQLQRAMPFAFLAILTVLAWHLRQAATAGRHALVLAMLLAPLAGLDGIAVCVCAIAVAATPRLDRRQQLAADVGVLAAIVALGSLAPPLNFAGAPRIFVAVGAIAIVIVLLPSLSPIRFRLAVTASAVLVSIATVGAFLAPARLESSSLGQRILKNSPSMERLTGEPATVAALSRLVRDSVPVDGLLLTPPLPSLEFLPFLSQRSVVISWKNVPYTDSGILEWGSRFDELLGSRHEETLSEDSIVAEWRRRTPDQITAAAAKYGASFVITRDEWGQALDAQRAGSANGWTLFRLRER